MPTGLYTCVSFLISFDIVMGVSENMAQSTCVRWKMGAGAPMKIACLSEIKWDGKNSPRLQQAIKREMANL